jgi:hypothetical protein
MRRLFLRDGSGVLLRVQQRRLALLRMLPELASFSTGGVMTVAE